MWHVHVHVYVGSGYILMHVCALYVHMHLCRVALHVAKLKRFDKSYSEQLVNLLKTELLGDASMTTEKLQEHEDNGPHSAIVC